jgi:hypothetical protein
VVNATAGNRRNFAAAQGGQSVARRIGSVSATTLQPIADWVEKLGLEQYAQRFAENDISCSVLPDLTGDDVTCQKVAIFIR